MSMKKKQENATVAYEPVQITGDVEISFTKTTTAGNTVIHGRIAKGGEEVGSVTRDVRADFLHTSLKPRSAVDADEAAAIWAAVPGCIAEMMED